MKEFLKNVQLKEFVDKVTPVIGKFNTEDKEIYLEYLWRKVAEARQ